MFNRNSSKNFKLKTKEFRKNLEVFKKICTFALQNRGVEQW